jgi:energy-coupling factor transport system substrate-specific component
VKRIITVAIYTVTVLIGLSAFLYPFFLPARQVESASAQDATLLTAVLLMLCLIVLLLEVQGHSLSVKTVAALGVLVAITSILRFVEVAIPLPGGFSPIFAPILVAGYVFGARFGFLMGTLTLFVSALITGGVGPWLPYQMFVAGWVGASAGWIPADRIGFGRKAILILAVFGFVWGILYGIIINLYVWPYLIGDAATSWQTGATLRETVTRYALFYAVTSLLWDVIRASGNVLLIVVLGATTLRALARFRDRISFQRVERKPVLTVEVKS